MDCQKPNNSLTHTVSACLAGEYFNRFHFRFFACTVFFLLYMNFEASATHLVGGSMTYTYAGQKDGYYMFKVKVDMFRDCSSIPPGQSAPTPFDPQISIGLYERKTSRFVDGVADTMLYGNSGVAGDQSGIFTFDINTPSPGADIVVTPPASNPKCQTQIDVCLRENYYEGTISVPPSNYGYYLLYKRCCRNAQENIGYNQGETYFAIIPPTTTLNSTPEFNTVPTPYICAYDTVSLSYAASEPDGDSLVYSLGWPYSGADANNPAPNPLLDFPGPDPLNAPDSSLTYVPYEKGYSPKYPFGVKGVAAIDKFTGILTLFALKSGRYALAVDIKEYRNGKYISTTRRDVQILVLDCPQHHAPQRVLDTSGLALDKSIASTYTVEAGTNIAFHLKYETSDSAAITNYTSSGFYENSIFTHTPTLIWTKTKTSLTGAFNWQTACKDASASPYTFTVGITDDGCPAKTTYDGIKIFVVPFRGANHIDGPNPACAGLPGDIYSTSFQKVGYKLTWIVTGGTMYKGPFDSTIRVVWGNGPTGTIKLIGYNSITGCRGDTVTMNVKINPKPSPPIILGPSTSCVGFTGSYAVQSNSFLNYKWTVNGGIISGNSPGQKLINVKWVSAGLLDSISVAGQDSNGCFTDTVTIKPIVEKPIVDTIFGSYSVCPNSSGIVYWVNSQVGSTYFWTVTGGTQVAGGNTSQIKIDWGALGTGRVAVVEKTAHGCVGDTVSLKITKDYVLYTSPIRGDTSLCEFTKGVVYQVSNSNGSVYAWKIVGGTIIAGQGTAIIVVDWDKAGTGGLTVTETAYDAVNQKPCIGLPVSVIVSIYSIPSTSEIIGPTGICEGDITIYSVTGLPGSTYLWKFHGKTNLSTSDTARWQEIGLTTLTDTFNIEVTELSKNNCPGPTRYLVVTAHKKPVTTEITGPNLICFPNLDGAVYSVKGFPTSVYDWTVDGGAIVNGDKTDKITVNWYIEGNRAVHVQEISDFGCKGPVKNLSVKVDSLSLTMDLVTTELANDKEIDIYWEKKNTEFFNGYFRIYRMQAGQEFYRLIDSVPATQTNYVDKHVNTGEYAYRYYIQAVNSCGYPIKTEVHRTINLNANFDHDTTIHLHWNPYEGWPVDQYTINNSQNDDTTITLYNFTKDTTYAVIKTLEGYRLCMRIAAFKAGTSLKSVISWSNKVCVDFDPVLWIPNAFTPQNGDNINNTFRVVAGNYTSYHIDIYNRWGEHVFSSDDPAKQWDGTFKGNICIEGVYLYMVNVVGAKANIYKSGTLNLLR